MAILLCKYYIEADNIAIITDIGLLLLREDFL